MSNYTAMDLDERVKDDSSFDFVLLEPGVYPFEVAKVENEYFNGSEKVPPCPKVNVSLRIALPDGSSTTVRDGILCYCEGRDAEGNAYGGNVWRISEFFRAIGGKRHGESAETNWSPDYLVGKKGMVKIGNRTYTATRGANKGKEMQSNEVVNYLDYSAPAQPASGAETDGEGW